MSIVCTICQDLITEIPERLPVGEEIIQALECGHLFHRSCIMEWFEEKSSTQSNHCDECPCCGECPCCKIWTSLSQGLQIFPSTSASAKAHVITDKSEQAELEEELNQINMVLEEVGCQLENERIEHQILKYEYTQKDSEVDELRSKKELSDRRLEEIENAYKGIVEKITLESKEAFEKLKIAETRRIDEKLELENHFINKIKEFESEKKVSKEVSCKNELDILRQDQEDSQADENKSFNKVQKYENNNKLRVTPISAEKACQTEGRDASLLQELQASLDSFKSTMLHMKSEITCLLVDHDVEPEKLTTKKQVDITCNSITVP